MTSKKPSRKKKCTGHRSDGTPCNKWAMKGRDVCYKHGGKTPRGADSPHFIHGGYSRYVQKDIADKVIAFQDADPFNLTDELTLIRALLADFLSRMEDPLTSGALDTAAMLVDRIRKTVESINRIKNDSALTAAEITYLAARAAEVVTRYIDNPDEQTAFIQDLFGGLAGSNPAIPGRLADEEARG